MMAVKASKAGALYAYQAQTRSLDREYPKLWGVVASADEVMRSNRWDRIRHLVDQEMERGIFRDNSMQSGCGNVSSGNRWESGVPIGGSGMWPRW